MTNSEMAAFLLKDLDRWTFGELLAKRAWWTGVDPDAVTARVRNYRLAILYAVLHAYGPPYAGLAAAVRKLRPLAPGEEAPYDDEFDIWEGVLAELFLRHLKELAPLGPAEGPLTRFAHGKYFKYSRRVSYLLHEAPILPCLFAPAPAP